MFVRILPWTPDYDTYTARGKRRPVWVSIHGLNAALEHLGVKTLKKLGVLLHLAGTKNSSNKFSDVRGLVLMPVDLDPPTSAGFSFKEGYVEYEISYEPLPEGCYTCHQNGHIAKFCPTTTQTWIISEEELEERKKQAEHEIAEQKAKQSIPVTNPHKVGVSNQKGAESQAPPNQSQTSVQLPSRTPTHLQNHYAVLEDLDTQIEQSQAGEASGNNSFDLNVAIAEGNPQGRNNAPTGAEAKDTETVNPYSLGHTQQSQTAPLSLSSPENNDSVNARRDELDSEDTASEGEAELMEGLVSTPTSPLQGRMWNHEAGNNSAPVASPTMIAGSIYLNAPSGLSAQKTISKAKQSTLKSQAHLEDTAGPTALARGQVLQEWNALDQLKDLSDVFYWALKRSGPRFTRQVVRNNRLDQARLDRVYVNQNGEWLSCVQSILHDGAEGASDHIPVKVDLLPAAINRSRRRSHLTWVKQGDACTKFFFATLQSKQAREKMEIIVTEEGETITQDTQIMKVVHDYYTDIYAQPPITEWNIQERTRVMQLIKAKVPDAENQRLIEELCMQELTTTVENMAREKAPGEDGIKVEVLLASWSWSSQGCLLLLLEFWKNKSLGCKNVRAVVKLLPKCEEKQFLRNWRPISLLPIIYKIAARILATRIKSLIPMLVDSEQAGFVDGRFITDNILALKLSQELANERKKPTIFCKLDFFPKAFDRVQHEFLWDTMRHMNFCSKYISLVQGLVSQGSAKVYLNGSSTASFQLQRGVRQGCPISSLLFALSTQPLMLMIREEERRGNLTGLEILDGHPLLHRLFVDDSGITLRASESNFSNLRTTIARFERISGAALNVSKSVILPMAMKRIPTWLHETGCKIMIGGDEVKYQGITAGAEVNEGSHARDLSNRLKIRLSTWANKFLSWPSKVMLLRHVLRSIPIYQFLGLGLNAKGFHQLEAICRTFMWGVNGEGRAKTPLIAWEGITKPYGEGGLHYTPFSVTADALKLRYITRLLGGEKCEWADMIRFFIRTGMSNHTNR
ncbi:hypothetical protein R1sor_010659 [Riccia sorocarpa]|uniref:CCHC-type domain-containing protein n=1 Tax=Riccia sorocarpa TaxID=122646 RepID=A0ABD3HYP3_9MARC